MQLVASSVSLPHLHVHGITGTGELFVALEHSFLHPEVYLYTFVFSAMGYGSVVFVLLLIKTSGSTNAEIVKSCRKVFTIGRASRACTHQHPLTTSSIPSFVLAVAVWCLFV